LKQRQKRKFNTSVAGLELFGMYYNSIWHVDVNIKEATKKFGKAFSCGASADKNVENLMEITIQGDVMIELGELINKEYNVFSIMR
jgi:translation initiation factor 1 (eIF-1/SUI1)